MTYFPTKVVVFVHYYDWRSASGGANPDVYAHISARDNGLRLSNAAATPRPSAFNKLKVAMACDWVHTGMVSGDTRGPHGAQRTVVMHSTDMPRF